MKRFVLAGLLVAGLGIVGCKNCDKCEQSSEPKKMAVDVCSHCPGDQTMTAEGKCSGCGASLKK